MDKVNKIAIRNQFVSLPYFRAITHRLKRKFLVAYACTGSIQEASKLAECDWRGHYFWLERDPEYKIAFEKAKQVAGDLLEGEIYTAVRIGDRHPVLYKGAITAYYMQKSDNLRMFMLKGFKPQYRDSFNLQQIAGPVQINIIRPEPPKTATLDVVSEPEK